jgi:hypothetical protein
MTLLTIPIGSVLLLLAVSLLFVKRTKKRTDWPSFVALCLLFAALSLTSWAWQYSKFKNQHGFYYFSPEYGGLFATGFHIILFVCIVAFLWRHRDQNS